MQSVVTSPASQFMSMSQQFHSTTGEIAYGLMGSVTSVPAGFSVETIISYTAGAPRRATARGIRTA